MHAANTTPRVGKTVEPVSVKVMLACIKVISDRILVDELICGKKTGKKLRCESRESNNGGRQFKPRIRRSRMRRNAKGHTRSKVMAILVMAGPDGNL